MSADDEAGRRLGAALVDRGWVQGAWFAPPSAAVYVNQFGDASGASPPPGARALKARERLIVVTQTCDIVSPDEPYVEALVCQRERSRDYLARLDRNSARQFVIDPAGGWVARAAYRVLIDKARLAELTPEPWPGAPERLDRFVRWLARRYDRPALPDVLVDVFQRRVEAALRQFDDDQPAVSAAFSAAVHEMRVNLPAHETPPFDLQFILLVRRDGLTELEADAIQAAIDAIRQGLDPGGVHLDPEVRIVTDEEISLAEYLATRPLFLEYLTYRGDEIEGSEPTPRG